MRYRGREDRPRNFVGGNGRHVVRLSYVGDTEGEPTLDLSENVAYNWLTLSEFKAHDDLDHYVKEILATVAADALLPEEMRV